MRDTLSLCLKNNFILRLKEDLSVQDYKKALTVMKQEECRSIYPPQKRFKIKNRSNKKTISIFRFVLLYPNTSYLFFTKYNVTLLVWWH